MESVDIRYTQASIATADNLKTVAEAASARSLSRLSLPEVEAVVEQVARLIPAGNVPGMILSGLVRLSGSRVVPHKTVKRDINLLFKGVAQTLDAAVYGTFFAGPAAVIWGYQQLLRLSGKNLDDAFPEGVWQFYVDYAMRDDTARHANETHGFDALLNRQQIRLSAAGRITAWVMAAIYCLHQYDALLTNEWRERVYTYLLADVTQNQFGAASYARLYRQWEKQRPYGRGPETLPNENYPDYRRRKFDQFLARATGDLRADLRDTWQTRIRQAEAETLSAYLRQMSILAYLEPGIYGETRTPIPLEQAYIGVIHRGQYYLVPGCVPGAKCPPPAQTMRAKIAALLVNPSHQSPPLTPLAEIQRAYWPNLREKMNEELLAELDKLRLAPILLNFDAQPSRLPLSNLRQAERGLGGHALTLFDTGATTVFDLSHIFFDGAWGAALSEIMTQEAEYWAQYLHELEPPPRLDETPPAALSFHFTSSDLKLVQQAPRVTPEVSAETELVNLKAMLKLRRLLKQRNDLIQLTVNDILILYRAIHTATYQPDPGLMAELRRLRQDNEVRTAALAAIEAVEQSQKIKPAIAMPVDAGRQNPQDRLLPITLEVPVDDLDLLNLHRQTLVALDVYEQASGDRSHFYANFDELQRYYLATLAGFGLVLSKTKEIAGMGQSFSVGTIKLLAHLPTPLQRMLEKVPNRFEMLNDIIRGREVFSNIGAVASGSSLTRFMSAKDDSDKKTLVWGAMTDANGMMRLTLRDFRPHVAQLKSIGRKDLAIRMTQDYLEAYAHGLNSYIQDLQRITRSMRQTQPDRPEKDE